MRDRSSPVLQSEKQITEFVGHAHLTRANS
jgi:hypothetical protein